MSTPTLNLYACHGSCSLAAHILLNDLRIPYTLTRMRALLPSGIEAFEPGKGPSREEYLLINPKGLVPTLHVTFPSSSEDGVTITELPAILTYISLLSPSPSSLLGSDPLSRAKVSEWLAFLSGTLHGQGFGALWRPRRFVGGEHEEEEEMLDVVRGKGREVIERAFGQIEGMVGEEFAVKEIKGDGEGEGGKGEQWTVVDANLYVFWRWGSRIGIEDMEKRYPRWGKVMRRTEGKESVRLTLEEEELERVFLD